MASASSFFIDAVRALSKGLIFAAAGFRDNRDGLRDVVNAMDLAMAVCSRDLSYTWASEGIGRLLERPTEEIIGRPIVEVIGQQAFEALKPYFDRVLAGEYVEYQEEVVYRHVGPRWIHAMYAPTRRPDGAVDGWVGLILNIDEQRRERERARESEDRFRRLADSAPVLMWMGDADGRNTFVNAQYAAYTGLSQTEIREQWKSLIHPDDRERSLGVYLDAIERGVEWQLEMRIRRHDGVYRWFELKGVPRYEGSRYVGYVGCSIDITERKMSEEAAREESRQKDQLIAVLGHELRNPMGAISNAVGILEKIEIDDDAGKRALVIARRQLNGLGRLVEDLFEVGNSIAGKVRLVRKTLDLSDTVRHAVQTLQASGATRFHSVQIITQSAWVEGDAIRLEQIVSNLVSNAVKFTPKQGRIDIRVSADNGRAILTVSDSGIGIPKEFLPRLFQPFAQLQAEFSAESHGLGLGLALTKRLVELHEGEISVECAGPGQGSTFTVSLPLIKQPMHLDLAQPRTDKGRNSLILIIEDNEDYRESLVQLLQIEGYRAKSAADAPEGIELALKLLPEIVLVDLALPTLDGYEVARRLREKFGSAIRIIAISGFGRDKDKTAASAAGFDEYLVKPVVTERLLEALRRIH